MQTYNVTTCETVITSYKVDARSDEEAKDKVIMQDVWDCKRLLDARIDDVDVEGDEKEVT